MMVDLKKLGSVLAPEGIATAGKHVVKAVAEQAVAHGPECLVVTAIVGLGTTVYLAVKEVPKAQEQLAKRPVKTDEEGNPSETRVERFVEDAKVVVPICAPAMVVGGMTVASIIGGNRLQAKELKEASKKIAALSAAYTLAEKASTAYQEEVIEKLGEETHKEIKQAANERMEQNPAVAPQTRIAQEAASGILNDYTPGDTLYYDDWTGYVFWSTPDKISGAFGELTREAAGGGTNVCELYHFLLGRDDWWELGTKFGWNYENLPGFHIYDATLEPDGEIPKAVLSYGNTIVQTSA